MMDDSLLNDVINDFLHLLQTVPISVVGLAFTLVVFIIAFSHSFSLFSSVQHPFIFATVLSSFFGLSFALVVYVGRKCLRPYYDQQLQQPADLPVRYNQTSRNLYHSRPRGNDYRVSPGISQRRSASPQRDMKISV
jgi:hypothetical protein